jgi:hypothetical protein
MIILYTMTQRQGQLEKSENQKFHKSKKAVAGKRMKRVVGCRRKIRKGDAEDIQKINRKPR